MDGSAAVLAGRRLSKRYGGVEVLSDVSIALRAGEVQALIGENGAGKSTLMKILSGYQAPRGGDLAMLGETTRFASSASAEAAGVVLIHQEFNLAEQLSVEANIFLGRELRRGRLLDVAGMRARARTLLAALQTRIDPRARVGTLAVPDRQMVEIAKALCREARVLLLDEPTAVLTPREARVLFAQIARLKASGVAILYTSHKLDEVRAIADQVTVLRDGRHVTTAPAATLSEDQMARLMVGRPLADLYPAKAPAPRAETVLRVDGLCVPGLVHDASFHLRRGEILGVAGLVGAGRTELMEAVTGLRRASRGRIELSGRTVRIGSAAQAARLGLAYLTEDRKGRGLLLGRSMRVNLTLLALDRFSRGRLGLIDESAEAQALARAIGEFDIRAPHGRVAVGQLSGGNQQKLLLAKTMLIEPSIVVIDEPTRGIDIGTKQQIYGFIARLAAAGTSVIVISSDMAEVIGLSHRVIVMRAGRIVGELADDAIGEEGIVRHAMGLAAMPAHEATQVARDVVG